MVLITPATTASEVNDTHTTTAGHSSNCVARNGLNTNASAQNAKDNNPVTDAPDHANTAAAGSKNATSTTAGVNGAAERKATKSESITIVHPKICIRFLLI